MSDTVTCVFVHGWAMNSAVWDDVIQQLPDWINVVLVDLPGHGSMADVEVNSLDDYVQALTPLVHRPVLWVGWSLGGLAVLRLAELYPERVAAALLVATNPCFVRRDDWSCGVDSAVFTQFENELNQQQKKTIRRFLALQVKGLPNAMRVVKKLQNSIDQRGEASSHALTVGLDILLKTDLRDVVRSSVIQHHVITKHKPSIHWCFGEKDSLVPKELANILQKDFSQKNIVVNEQASHAPFISHSENFIKQLIGCAEKIRDNQCRDN